MGTIMTEFCGKIKSLTCLGTEVNHLGTEVRGNSKLLTKIVTPLNINLSDDNPLDDIEDVLDDDEQQQQASPVPALPAKNGDVVDDNNQQQQEAAKIPVLPAVYVADELMEEEDAVPMVNEDAAVGMEPPADNRKE